MKGPAVYSATAEAVHKGVFLILLATLCIVLMNTCAKFSSVAHGPVEMAGTGVVIASNLFILRRVELTCRK